MLHLLTPPCAPRRFEQMAALMQTVPDIDGSEIILETTGKEFGDEFHQLSRMGCSRCLTSPASQRMRITSYCRATTLTKSRDGSPGMCGGSGAWQLSPADRVSALATRLANRPYAKMTRIVAPSKTRTHAIEIANHRSSYCIASTPVKVQRRLALTRRRYSLPREGIAKSQAIEPMQSPQRASVI